MSRDQAVILRVPVLWNPLQRLQARDTWTSLWFCPFLRLLPQYDPLLQRWKVTGCRQLGFWAQFPTKHALMVSASTAAQQERICTVKQLVVSTHCPQLHIWGKFFLLLLGSSGLQCPFAPWQLCDGNQSMVSGADQEICYESAPLS